MPGGQPRGMLMPSPRATIKFTNAPPPGTDNVSKCPAVARGGMCTAGIDWCIERFSFEREKVIGFAFAFGFHATWLA